MASRREAWSNCWTDMISVGLIWFTKFLLYSIYSSSITSAKGSYNSRNISDIPQLVSKRSSTKVGSFTNASQCTAYDPEKEPIKVISFFFLKKKNAKHSITQHWFLGIPSNTTKTQESYRCNWILHRNPWQYSSYTDTAWGKIHGIALYKLQN